MKHRNFAIAALTILLLILATWATQCYQAEPPEANPAADAARAPSPFTRHGLTTPPLSPRQAPQS